MAKPRDLKLDPGERVVFQSRAGGTAGHPTWIYLVVIFGGMQAIGALIMVVILGGSLGTVSAWGSLLAGIAFFGLWLRLRIGPAFFLSDKRLFRRKFFGGVESFSLAKLRSCHRYTARYYTSYGPQDVTTTRLVLGFGDRADVLFGPVKKVEDLAELLHSGVLARHVDLRALPSVDGSPSPAEARGDIFLGMQTATGGMTYGPLFLGPTKLLRFTDELPEALKNQLLTLVSADARPEEIEEQLIRLARHPGARHSNILEMGNIKLAVAGSTLTVHMEGRSEAIDLPPKDAERAAKYLVTQRPAHPMR